MGFEQREGSGIMFKNDRRTNERAPTWKGTALFEGKEVELAAWEKPGKNGTFLSVSIKAKDASRQPEAPF